MVNRRYQFIIVFSTFAILVLTLGLAVPVNAFEFKGGDVVVIDSGEVIDDDLYVTAATIEVHGTIKGDLIAMGSNIIISTEGVVEGDIITGGQSVVINGKVMDDARIAGAVLTVGDKGQVGDDIVAAGYSLETKPGSKIGGDLLFAGAQALLEGFIGGDVKVNAGGVQLNGQIVGDAEFVVGGQGEAPPFSPFQFIPNMPAVPVIASGFSIGADTLIEGNLDYQSPQPADVPSWAVEGEVNFEEVETVDVDEGREPEPTTAEKVWQWFLSNLRKFISLLIIGLLVAWLLSNLLEQAAAQLQAHPWPSLGWGALIYFGFYFVVMLVFILTIILMVLFSILTLAGIAWVIFGLGLVTILNMVLAFVIATSFLSKIILSYLGGRLVLERLKPEWALNIFWSFILGVTIFVILTAIPFIGWIVNVAVVFFGLGALFLLAKNRWIKSGGIEVKKSSK